MKHILGQCDLEIQILVAVMMILVHSFQREGQWLST